MDVGRIINVNDVIPYLPCLNHKDGAPTVITAMNVKYREIELHTIVFNTVNLCTLMVFLCSELVSYRYYKVGLPVDQGLRLE